MGMMNGTPGSHGVLLHRDPLICCLQALLSFAHWDSVKSGQLIGDWLTNVHKMFGIKTEYIGSHTVDGAANTGKFVAVLEWNTNDGRSQKIIADNCDAHKVNTTASQDSGTSIHVINLNPDSGNILSKFHRWMVKICSSGARQQVLKNVQDENNCENCPALNYAVRTHWNYTHQEVSAANANQHNLTVAMRRILSPGGVDET